MQHESGKALSKDRLDEMVIEEDALSKEALEEEILSSTENYRSAVDKWCIKATNDDYMRWDYELETGNVL